MKITRLKFPHLSWERPGLVVTRWRGQLTLGIRWGGLLRAVIISWK